jgi:hypothetical protein
MSDQAVFDLGEIDPEFNRPQRPQSTVAARPVRSRQTLQRPVRDAGWDAVVEVGSTGLALLLPGTGQLLRAQFARGLCFLAWLGFLGTLGWALLGTLDRLGPTLDLLGVPSLGGVWALGSIFVLVAVLHVASMFGAVRDGGVPGPVTAGVLSGLVPGWGQALTGRRWSAAFFLTGCWIVVASWLLVSPPVRALLDAHALILPPALTLLSSPVVRWSLPAVLWTLAVYDAAVRAARSN